MTDSANKPLRVVQVTDCHLFASPDGKLLGLNTEFSLGKVLELIEKEQPAMDLILATGDLAQDASLPAYRRLEAHLTAFKTPIYWLEGNHDKSVPMLEALQSQQGHISPCVAKLGNWSIILLDSTIPNEVPGELFDDDLAFLDRALTTAAGDHVMVCLHHHPVPMGCAWLDTQQIAGAERFFAVIDRHPCVRTIVWGHVHQEYAGTRNGVELFSAPSTCVQFKPGSEDFAVDDTAPGYRWFDLYPDGHIESQVSRVEDIRFEVDFSVKGY